MFVRWQRVLWMDSDREFILIPSLALMEQVSLVSYWLWKETWWEVSNMICWILLNFQRRRSLKFLKLLATIRNCLFCWVKNSLLMALLIAFWMNSKPSITNWRAGENSWLSSLMSLARCWSMLPRIIRSVNFTSCRNWLSSWMCHPEIFFFWLRFIRISTLTPVSWMKYRKKSGRK